MSDVNLWEIEDEFYAKGVSVICGVDEAGRGPLAGPVCAAAVILPPHLEIPGLNDSKKLTDKRRRELMPVIKEQALAYGIAFRCRLSSKVTAAVQILRRHLSWQR